MSKVKTNFKSQGPRHKLHAWRKYRGLTMEQLAERAGLTHGTISQLERGLINYTQATWERLAEELQCTPGELIAVDPTQDDAIWSIWDKASIGQRQEIAAVANALVKARKSG